MFHFKGSVKVGEVYHFDIEVKRDELVNTIDSISSSGEDAKDARELHLRVKNTTSALMRPAYLAGPYILYTAIHESDYRHDTPVGEHDHRPHFDANVKASSSRWQKLPIEPHKSKGKAMRTFHLEVASQSLFSPSATTYFEVTLGWNEAEVRKLARSGKAMESVTPGLQVRVHDTWSLWQMHPVERDHAGHHVSRARVVRPPTVLSRDSDGNLCDHLVVLTHGIHSNLTADMLYLKQVIERTSKAQGGRTVCKGFAANACNTERGVRWLGKRVAEWVLNETGWVFESDGQIYRQPNQYKRISFIAHSLGGLVQTYALGWLHDRTFGGFLDASDIGLEPVNFITLATPWLGISAENPAYVKLALDFGVVGKTGQDLGLTVKPLGTYSSYSGPDAAAKTTSGPAKVRATRPLLRLLSEDESPCRRAISLFKRRTVYANIENDGIVPLRTSSLFFLDWEGMEATHAQHESAGVAQSQTPPKLSDFDSSPESSDHDATTQTPVSAGPDISVASSSPIEPSEAAQTRDPTRLSLTGAVRGVGSLIRRVSQGAVKADEVGGAPESNAGTAVSDKSPSEVAGQHSHSTVLDVISNYLKPQSGSNTAAPTGHAQGVKQTKKPSKAFRRSQTIGMSEQDGKEPQQLIEPKHTSFLRALEAVIRPPGPDFAFIYDPASRPKQTIVHDRLYKPSDIPPLKPATASKSSSLNTHDSDLPITEDIAALDDAATHKLQRARKAAAEASSSSRQAAVRLEKVRLEERIARNWHRDMEWRKVLVRLLPDAHNNIIVRRRFANSYGWPVLDHLCEHHFGAEAETEKLDRTAEEEAEAAELERVLSDGQTSMRASVRRQKSWDAATLHEALLDNQGAFQEKDEEDFWSSDAEEEAEVLAEGSTEHEERDEQIIRMSEVSAGL
ncbi:putative serine esterase-domain-containing protein [Protomyces lactucae-debilis]|uniref:Putative serine esterase-domain-containing protein n=1 Tax=Protomyces lactucae-debilis TaxID=2754530 RepID=A0A1Y2FM80_PROLT|nr:putative serine esterase-domain-containing protein [Protomyces lactucae-debilis]ORY84464.1 putative serine esterase-domain-containing protein [Protomyces lactucae-debilis]